MRVPLPLLLGVRRRAGRGRVGRRTTVVLMVLVLVIVAVWWSSASSSSSEEEEEEEEGGDPAREAREDDGEAEVSERIRRRVKMALRSSDSTWTERGAVVAMAVLRGGGSEAGRGVGARVQSCGLGDILQS